MLMRIVRQFAHLTFDIRLDGHQLRCREQLRRDGHAPILDGLDSLQAGSNGSILGFIKFDTPSVNSIEHPHDWANSFPGHALSPLEHDRYRCQQCPVPTSTCECSDARFCAGTTTARDYPPRYRWWKCLGQSRSLIGQKRFPKYRRALTTGKLPYHDLRRVDHWLSLANSAQREIPTIHQPA